MFPQISPTDASPYNPIGCWDWWGGVTPQYAMKAAPQMRSIIQMTKTLRMLNRAIAISTQ